MSKVGIKVFGVKETTAYLRGVENKMNKNIASTFVKIALIAEREVKTSISGREAEPMSVDTGLFMRSITSASGKDFAKVASNVRYAKYLEYGTSRLKERRHFRNSISRKNKDYVAMLNTAVKKAT